MRSIAVASGKGGVGKTTVAVNLSAGFAAKGKRVLLVDLDAAGHASTWLLGNRADVGIAEALLVKHLDPAMVFAVPDRPGLFMAPASPGLRNIKAQLAGEFAAETIMRDMVRAPRSPQFDVVIYDCPPGTELLTQSAVFASDFVIIPVLPGFLGITGVIDMENLIKTVRSRARAKVSLLGCVIFGADDRERMTEETREQLRQLDLHICAAEVRISTAAKMLPAGRAVAIDPGRDDRGAVDYRALLKETEARL
jgi:chromosome partitioning protein